jgi:hypothetical protein
MRLAVAAIIHQNLEDLNLKYPKVTKEHKKELQATKQMLLAEKD